MLIHVVIMLNFLYQKTTSPLGQGDEEGQEVIVQDSVPSVGTPVLEDVGSGEKSVEPTVGPKYLDLPKDVVGKLLMMDWSKVNSKHPEMKYARLSNKWVPVSRIVKIKLDRLICGM